MCPTLVSSSQRFTSIRLKAETVAEDSAGKANLVRRSGLVARGIGCVIAIFATSATIDGVGIPY